MTKKLTLTGTDNDGFRHRYSIKKNEKFKKIFPKFMEHLGFDPKKISKIFFTDYQDEDDDWIPVELKVKDFEDCIRHFENKKYDVDVFFGRFKIILVIRTKKRIPMVEFLENEVDWIKALEIKKFQEKHKKKILARVKSR